MPVRLQHIDEANRALLERLLQFYGHDLSEFEEQEPDFEGRFCDGTRQEAWAESMATVRLVTVKERPAGFIVSHAGSDGTGGRIVDLFVMRCYRRLGIGSMAVESVLDGHFGDWSVEFASENRPALRFWRSFLSRSGHRSVKELSMREGRAVRVEFRHEKKD